MKQNMNKNLLIMFAMLVGSVAQADVYIQRTPHRIDFNTMIQENDHNISQLRKEITEISEQGEADEKSVMQSELSSTSAPQPERQLSSSKSKLVVQASVTEKAGK